MGEMSEASVLIPRALLASDPRGPHFRLSLWNPVVIEVAECSWHQDLGHIPAQTGLIVDFLP